MADERAGPVALPSHGHRRGCPRTQGLPTLGGRQAPRGSEGQEARPLPVVSFIKRWSGGWGVLRGSPTIGGVSLERRVTISVTSGP